MTRREWLVLCVILLAAAGLNLFRLSDNGYGNTYYAAAVKSMLTSAHSFLFASYDPLGFVSVDKPPLGFWIQVVSTRLFGFAGIWLMLPQAIAGIASVALLFVLVRRTGGTAAGLIAAALLALSPVNVVVNRSNIFESLVVLTLLAATWMVLRAIEQRRLRWLLAAGLMIGVGFNIKGLEAWLIIPVLAVTYLCAVPIAPLARVRNLAVMLLVVFMASVSWVAIVDRVPASERPYVDSTLTNSEFDLMLNYNGLQRLVGEPGYGGKAPVIKHYRGDLGLIRLFQPTLGGQVSWFLPLALLGLLASGWGMSRSSLREAWMKRNLEGSQTALLLWGGWLLCVGGFFSVALRFNEYYLAVLAPAVCALAGCGIVRLWRDRMQPNWRGWLFVFAFGLTGVEQLIILSGYPEWGAWQIPLMIGVCIVGTVLLGNIRLLQTLDAQTRSRRGLQVISAGVWIMLLIVPLRWTTDSLTPEHSAEFPISGPSPLTRGNTIVPVPDPVLIAYLDRQAQAKRFILATTDIETASAMYLKTGRPIMAMGGFSGYDPILTPDTLAARVAGGGERFFLIPTSNLTSDQAQALYGQEIITAGSPFTTTITNDLTRWISAACKPVGPKDWQTAPHLDELQLYDCGR